jgi:type III secretory pathway component EscV
MKAFFIQYIVSFFSKKAVKPAQAKFFYVVILFSLSWLTVSQETTKNRVDRIGKKVERIPGIVRENNQALAIELYTDAQLYAGNIIGAITRANEDVLNEIDITERRRNQLIEQMNARFDGLVNEVERLKEMQKINQGYEIKSRKIGQFNKNGHEIFIVEK